MFVEHGLLVAVATGTAALAFEALVASDGAGVVVLVESARGVGLRQPPATAALRAAHMLSAAMPGVVGQTPVSYEDDKLVLTLPQRLRILDGERLRRRFATLARELDREPEVRLATGPRRLAV